jgi:hypothetical protein
VAPLHRAVAFSEGEHRPVCVRKELHLDVARSLDVALAVDRAVPEGPRRLALRRSERVVELGLGAHDPHAPSAAPGRRLHEEREADVVRWPVREHGDSGFTRDPLRLELVPAQPQRVGRGADPRDAGALDRRREVRVLREEAVSGVDRVRAGLRRSPEVLLRVQVAPDLHDLVGAARMQRSPIVGRDDGDGRDTELPAGSEDADCDLPSVRDEQLADLHRSELYGSA